MNLRNILLGVGVLALIAGAGLAVLWLSQPTVTPLSADADPPIGTQLAEPANLTSILTASHELPAGALLRSEDLAWMEVSSGAILSDAIVRSEGAEAQVLGALTTRDIAAGEPLVRTALIKPTDRGFLAALLSPGSRAVSIAVDATQTASGLLMPDNRVDIILTQTFEAGSEPARKSVGETILKNLRVIAVDQRLGVQAAPDANWAAGRANDVPKTITLEVSEREAEILTVAGQLGKIEVAVRALGRADGNARSDAEAAIPTTWAGQVSPALRTFRRNSGAPSAPVAASATNVAATPAKIPLEVMHGPKTETR